MSSDDKIPCRSDINISKFAASKSFNRLSSQVENKLGHMKKAKAIVTAVPALTALTIFLWRENTYWILCLTDESVMIFKVDRVLLLIICEVFRIVAVKSSWNGPVNLSAKEDVKLASLLQLV
jgi:hypothetical protein